MTNTNESTLNSYYFQYYGWIPSYRDFDVDDMTIKAATEEEAWEKFRKYAPFVKNGGLVSINGVKVEKTS
jgi:hypothetical protein